MSKENPTKEEKLKTLKKSVKRAFRPRNIGRVLIFIATIALLATSILPYMF